ncbi:hypothetical protein [Taibaiella koreensis]|uniref:hypothetical protein n=1 Tax=Taibaiella koreensis TaxID=1268548 RepID=UPI000E59A23A|nr:hypothetical protein [Taibaiella koreensis]
MDGLFEIYVPKKYIDNGTIVFVTPQYELDGILYPQGDPTFIYNQNLKMVITPRENYVNNHVPNSNRRDDWERLEVLGTEVDDYFSCLFESTESENNSKLKKVISEFLKDIDHYILVWLAEGDSFNEVSKIEDVAEFFYLLENESNYATAGVLAFK